jgi:tripartite-type tricarboxylate transporter receptor subunit TctC
MTALHRALGALGIALLAMAAAPAAAQDYPTRVVRMIVPVPPGGSTDIYARILAKELHAAWGQSFVVENRPGATGLIGTELAKRAPADGHTLLFTSNTAHVLGPLLQNPRPFDAAADFTPVSKAVRFPLYLVVHPSVPARSVKEFIAFAKARPGQLIYASSGQGGTSHLVTELFNEVGGIKATHVPYKGTSPALQSVMSGETHYIFNNIGVSQPLVAAGRLRGFAITGDKRMPALPDVPTMSELGIKGLEDAYTWLGMLAPAGLPQAVTAKLSAEAIRIVRTPEMEKRIANDGYLTVANAPEQFRKELQAEVVTWSRVIKSRGIKPE